VKKYIFVTGGVCSSLGKGVAAASLGSLIESHDLRIRMVKIDPYINVDAGTMSPYQHGEVYVTDDGAETDLDLGNYARFTNSVLNRASSVTTGQIYQDVIRREREGSYLGRTVQVIPHVTDLIKQRVLAVGEHPDVDVTIVEIGGTVGDIESVPFLEAARLKTKPTQHSVKELRAIGIQPDVLLCRAPRPLNEELRRKIALFTNVPFEAVFSAYDVPTTIYEIPIIFHDQLLDEIVLDRLCLPKGEVTLDHWKRVVGVFQQPSHIVRIGVVGKYIDLHDSYKSVDEALYHGGIANDARVELVKIDSESLEHAENDNGLAEIFDNVDGILVPGGFGSRGIEGMIRAAHYAREHQLPYFGICLGLQVMVVEYARNVLNYRDANSTEFDSETSHPVVSLLEEQIDVKSYGGTMRLGSSDSHLLAGTRIREIYGKPVIQERHRHRHEVSNRFRQQLTEAGLIVAAVTSDHSLVESIQWPDHRWGIGVQFHPEFKSKPTAAHPLFESFVAASIERSTSIAPESPASRALRPEEVTAGL
jgi:CTP synthase